MARKAIFGYASVLENLGNGGSGDLTALTQRVTTLESEVDNCETRIGTLEDEYGSLLTGVNNYLTDIKLQTTNANATETKLYNNMITIVKIFDKSKFDNKSLANLVDVQYHRYNTNYDGTYLINFGWYRINSSATETSSSVDKIYCVFTFVNNDNQTNAESFLSAANRNMLIFRFKNTIGG